MVAQEKITKFWSKTFFAVNRYRGEKANLKSKHLKNIIFYA